MTSTRGAVGRRRAWGAAPVWSVATVVIGALVPYRGVPGCPFPSHDALVVVFLSATTAALLWWLGPVPADALRGATPVTRRLWAASTVVGSLVVLAAVGTSGSYALVALATVAVVVLALLVRSLSRREIGWAVAFGVVAAAAGLVHGVGVARLGLVVSGAAQLPLVAVTLLAGWALARCAGWTAQGIGPASVLSGGPAAALRSFLLGV